MVKKLDTEQRKMIYETRRNFLDNLTNFNIKTFYGWGLAFVALFVASIYNMDAFLGIGIHPLFPIITILVAAAIIIPFMELVFLRVIFRQYTELIEDIRKDNLEKQRKFSIKDYLCSHLLYQVF